MALLRSCSLTLTAMVVATLGLSVVSCSKAPPAANPPAPPPTSPQASAASSAAAPAASQSQSTDAPPNPDAVEIEASPDETADSTHDPGLDWLVRHQFPDGHWQFDHSPMAKGLTTGSGKGRGNMVATALAILAFQSAGFNHKEGRFQKLLDDALKWMMDNRQADGSLVATGDEMPPMAHGLATMAVCEAARVSKDKPLERAAKAAAEFSIKTQLANGSWPRGPGDERGGLEPLAWHLLALGAARSVGVDLPSEKRDKCRSFLEALRAGDARERFHDRVRPPAALSQDAAPLPSTTLSDERLETSMGQLCQLLLGVDAADPTVLAAADYFLAWPVSMDRRDCLYWFFATHVLDKVGGDRWTKWHAVSRRVLQAAQIIGDGTDAGSWDPLKPTKDLRAPTGGRHMVTCFCILVRSPHE